MDSATREIISLDRIRTLGHILAMTAMVGPPTYPAPIQRIFRSHSSLILMVLICLCLGRSQLGVRSESWFSLRCHVGQIVNCVPFEWLTKKFHPAIRSHRLVSFHECA